MNDVLTKLIVNFLCRFITKNPKWAKVIQYSSVIVTIITGLPLFLQNHGITVDPKFAQFENQTVALCAIAATILSQLPNVGIPSCSTTTTTTTKVV